MSDPNGIVLHEVFGSDLDSGEEEELRRNLASPGGKLLSASRSATRKAPVMPDSDSGDDFPTKGNSSSAAPRRPIEFSDSDDDDEPESVRRRSSKSENLPYPHDFSDDERRTDVKRKRTTSGSKSGKKLKKARLRRERDAVHEDNFIDDDLARRGGHDEDDVIRTEGGMHVSDEIEGEPEEDELPRSKKSLNAIERAIEDNKAFRRPRRKEMDPKKIEAECIAFLERMMGARDSDIKAYRSGKPALNKLKILRDVELMAMKVSHREILLDNMFLAIVKAWLDPMPDGALPNVEIRSTLLQILLDIPVDSDWVERLHSSQGLGKLIHFLSMKDNIPSNRRLADKLMKRWARPVYQSNNNYHDLLDEFDRPEEGRKAPKDSVAAERKAARETVKHFQTAQEKLQVFKHKTNEDKVLATIPRRTPFLFTALAESSASIDEKALREMRSAKSRNKKVNRTMSTLRRANKNRSARAAKPSVNGRN